jgi:SAM-dependent methyltransferase
MTSPVPSAPSSDLYGDLSHYYDLLCADVDYAEQANFALRANGLLGNGGRRYLDLACGSGAHLPHFVNAGFDCVGLDISAPMLVLAAARCPQARLLEQDMSSLKMNQELDFITCFLYSLHYSHPLSQYQQTLQRVYDALAPGGLFCFDAVDKHSVANDIGYTHKMTVDASTLAFHSRWFYSGSGDRLDLHVQIRDQQQQYNEHHVMTAVGITQIQNLLETVGFSVNIFERNFNRLIPWQGKNGNVVFCANK